MRHLFLKDERSVSELNTCVLLALAVKAGWYPSIDAALADALAVSIPPPPDGVAVALASTADALGQARDHLMFLAGTVDPSITP